MTEHMQFTKDQLIEAALEYQGLLQRRVSNGDDEEWTRDSRLHIKLTEIALAALAAEPVGYIDRHTGVFHSSDSMPGNDLDRQLYFPVFGAHALVSELK